MPAERRPRRPFLTARWSNLLLVSYAVDDDALRPHLPAGLELDRFEGRAAVSLVAFDFLDTRVRGVRWPGLISFPEVNLRYYVRQPASDRHPERRGVSFIRELVPKWLIAATARRLYNEPYVACPMRSSVEAGGTVRMRHWFSLGGSEHTIEAEADAKAAIPPEGSPEHWFKEHQWGFGKDRRGRLLVYEVRHPHWETRGVRSFNVGVDFAKVYGEKWAILKDAEPVSVAWAVGSGIEVYPHARG
ncbi:MAG: DUF2071 domain-containing protein [Phycisphaerales bacterium]